MSGSKIRKAYIFGAVLSATLMVGISLGALIVADTPTGFPTVIEPGSLVDNARYIIFRDGSSYYAKNGTTGAIDYYSADASVVVRAAVNHTGIIVIREGTYPVEMVGIPSNTHIFGAGRGATILKMPDGSTTKYQGEDEFDVLYTLNGCQNSSVQSLSIDGNYANNQVEVRCALLSIHTIDAPVIGVDEYWPLLPKNFTARDLSLYNAPYNGLVVAGMYHVIENVQIMNNLHRHLMYLPYLYNSVVRNVVLEGHTKLAALPMGTGTSPTDYQPVINVLLENIVIRDIQRSILFPASDFPPAVHQRDVPSSRNVIMRGLTVLNPSEDTPRTVIGVPTSLSGFYYEGRGNSSILQVANLAAGSLISGVRINITHTDATTNFAGIDLRTAETIVQDVYVYEADASYYRGIWVNPEEPISDIIIRNCLFSVGDWSIRLAGTTYAITNIRVESIQFLGSMEIYASGTVTYPENSGVATITGAVNTVTVDHSLTDTPTIVFITGNNAGIGNYYVTSKTTTQFVITFENQPGGSTWTFYWYAEV